MTKRPLPLAGLDKVAILALDKNGSAWPDKLLTRDNMKSAIRSPNLKIWPLVRFWLIKRPLRPLAPKIPPLSSLGNLFREARPATPQRQNDGSEREGGCRSSFGRRPENCFGKPDGPRTTERARATARVCHGCRGSFSRRPESCFEKQRASSQRQNYGSERKRRAPPRLSRKLQPSPRKFSREARRARPQRQNDGNKLSGSPTGQTQAQTFDDSSRREKWHATRPGRVSSNPKP